MLLACDRFPAHLEAIRGLQGMSWMNSSVSELSQKLFQHRLVDQQSHSTRARPLSRTHKQVSLEAYLRDRGPDEVLHEVQALRGRDLLCSGFRDCLRLYCLLLRHNVGSRLTTVFI